MLSWGKVVNTQLAPEAIARVKGERGGSYLPSREIPDLTIVDMAPTVIARSGLAIGPAVGFEVHYSGIHVELHDIA